METRCPGSTLSEKRQGSAAAAFTDCVRSRELFLAPVSSAAGGQPRQLQRNDKAGYSTTGSPQRHKDTKPHKGSERDLLCAPLCLCGRLSSFQGNDMKRTGAWLAVYALE